MSDFAEIKKWLEETKEEPLEEMGSFFEKRVEGYEAHMAGWKKNYEWMARLVPEKAAALLDIGCGTGLELDEIFRLHPEILVTAIDLEQAMLDKLQKKHRDKELSVICGDYFQVPFGKECFDTAVSFETLHHFKPEDKLVIFKKLHDCLKVGGCYIQGDYAAESEEMEAYLFAECERRRKRSGIPEGTFVHFDTPLTLEHEMQLLRAAGFGHVECMGYLEEEHTPMIRAVK